MSEHGHGWRALARATAVFAAKFLSHRGELAAAIDAHLAQPPRLRAAERRLLRALDSLAGAVESPPAMSMPPDRQYAMGALFGPAKFDIGQFTPYAGRLRMRVVEVGPGFAVLALPYDEELVGDPQRKVVFGGAVTALIDQASGLAVACAMEELLAIATIDLRVDYLRAAVPGLEIIARADCYKLGHNVAFVRATAWDKDEADPFASCLGTFMVGANSGGSPFGGFKGEKAKA